MTLETDEIEKTEKMALTLDICSSSHIIEDLLKTENIKTWRDLLIGMKEQLMALSNGNQIEPYKFIGDGWLILFPKPYCSKSLIDVLRNISLWYSKQYEETILPNLDIPPEVSGLTFGVDAGQLVKLTMMERPEYVGRPINIACRLQGAITKIDIKSGYHVLMSHRLFNMLALNKNPHDTYSEQTERSLRNICEGRAISCYRLCIPNENLTILNATYGVDGQEIDVTFQYAKQVKNNTLHVKVSNEVAEQDPSRGVHKRLKIRYFLKRRIFDKTVEEGEVLKIQ